jgi:hypothetical protein
VPITVGRLLVGVSAVALVLALGIALLSTGDPLLTVRVFNKTTFPLDDLNLQFNNVEPIERNGRTSMGGA